jgi:hypothetical protein
LPKTQRGTQQVVNGGDISLAMNMLVMVTECTMSAMDSMRKKEQGEKKSEKINFVLERHIRVGSKECGGTESAGRGKRKRKESR